MPQKIDLSGSQFGYIKPIEPTDKRDGTSIVWKCLCTNCGSTCYYSASTLRNFHIVSCGCSRLEKSKANLAGDAHEKLGLVENTNVSRIKSSKLQKNNKSGVRGVCQRGNAWLSYIYFQKKRYHLYYGNDFDEAVRLRKAAEKELFGNFLEWYNDLSANQTKEEISR